MSTMKMLQCRKCSQPNKRKGKSPSSAVKRSVRWDDESAPALQVAFHGKTLARFFRSSGGLSLS
ncbi:hypothetical protein H257_14506 [Aphanomyces astaci]|uniref:Uncharacterized protein n=1 Tax=Aphanomyces astaci TaxID=112090 RepID=W4FQY7_APHAT|nr:hypothetical protein H257_14506 [Aphanomyces astaci]ETV69907.1 hypothetical protein H257_14506 [Aphanomyces astaci]|eukprot:XP_009840645.1 hypothetical protein H257_14506 [Aphanomyces astaci]